MSGKVLLIIFCLLWFDLTNGCAIGRNCFKLNDDTIFES